MLDSDLNGGNDTVRLGDDPSVGGAGDPTTFVVAAVAAIPVPALLPWALLVMAGLLSLIGVVATRR